MLAAEDVERQITVMAIIAVKETALLLAVEWVVGGIQIEHDLRRRIGVRFQKHLDQQAIDGFRLHHDLVIAFLLVHLLPAQLQPVQRALARQPFAAIRSCLRSSPVGSRTPASTASNGSARN